MTPVAIGVAARGGKLSAGNSEDSGSGPELTELEQLRRRVDRLTEECRVLRKERQFHRAWFASMDRHAPFELWFKDKDSRYLLVNNKFERAIGISRDRLLGKTPADLFEPDRAERLRTVDLRVMAMDDGLRRIVPCDGTGIERTYEEVRFPVYDESGELIGVGCFSSEISGRSKAQEALERAQSSAKLGNWRWSIRNKSLISCSDEFTRIHGSSRTEIFALMEERVERVVHPENREEVEEVIRRATETGAKYDVEYRIVLADGRVKHLIEIGEILLDSDGGPVEHVGTVQDITERKRAEEALRESERALRESNLLKTTILDSALDCVVSIDSDGCIIEWNAAADRTFGYSRDEVLGKKMVDLIIPPALRPAHYAGFEHYLKTGEGKILGQRVELSAVRADGREFPIEIAINSQISGANHIITAYLRDITEEKKAEERLLQAQKMEAVGQLTGGVAHDFNNLLAVIQGNAELLASTTGAEDPFTPAILRATARGAELTQRLLAFSRQQPLQTKSIDLAGLVDEMSELLKRTLGETIEIETITRPDLWAAAADPGQVEIALLNLAINSRDAMPGGGILTIEWANAPLDEAYVARNPEALVGDYVVLTVTDSGVGMPAEVREHAFEPFFTTKEIGEGAGLGLSMVYGFAKQSGGHVTIDSEDGRGTTVKLYLPRDKSVVPKPQREKAAQMPRGRGESVLLIEDDSDVRMLTVKTLEGLGYRVTDVPEAASARAVLERGDKVDLMLSDVVLPGGQSGLEFAEEARDRYPALKVIFMSGYPAQAATRDGFLRSGQRLLNKPFQRRQLAKALHEVLNREAGS